DDQLHEGRVAGDGQGFLHGDLVGADLTGGVLEDLVRLRQLVVVAALDHAGPGQPEVRLGRRRVDDLERRAGREYLAQRPVLQRLVGVLVELGVRGGGRVRVVARQQV